ncbi:MAG TPA: CotS family spore coat protein [Bacillota bacterium]|nr:CotS family spore coat protein [Bacillota bacterium]
MAEHQPLLEEYSFRVFKSEPSRKVFKLSTGQGDKSLKGSTLPIEDLQFMFNSMEHLWNRGFYRFARINLTSSGKAFIRQGNRHYFVSDWISGKEADYRSEQDVRITAACLAEMHETSKGLSPGSARPPKYSLGEWPENFYRKIGHLQEFLRETRPKKHKTRFDRLFLRYWDSYYEEALTALEYLRLSPYQELVNHSLLSPSLCHHDIAHHNVIIRDGQGYLIDFDYCICDLRIHDIASLVIRVLKKNNWNTAKGEKALKYYHRHSGIWQKELKVMLPFMMFPQDFWQVAWTYYREDIGRTEKESLSRMEKVLKMNEQKKEFLREFARWT